MVEDNSHLRNRFHWKSVDVSRMSYFSRIGIIDAHNQRVHMDNKHHQDTQSLRQRPHSLSTLALRASKVIDSSARTTLLSPSLEPISLQINTAPDEGKEIETKEITELAWDARHPILAG